MPVDKPEMHPVRSSNVTAVGHHADRNELHVSFGSGGHYVYHDVPAEHFEAMRSHKSPGSYLASRVKGQFKHTRIDD